MGYLPLRKDNTANSMDILLTSTASYFNNTTHTDTSGDNGLIIGDTNTINANDVMLGGARNVANGRSSIVSGEDNTENGTRSIVTGDTNTNNSAAAIVAGLRNTVTSQSSFVAGEDNTDTGNRNLTVGDGNTVAGTLGITAGQTNNIDSATTNFLAVGNTLDLNNADYSAVFGQRNTVNEGSNLITGIDHTITGSKLIVGGDTNVITGSITNSIIGGQNNAVSGSQSLVAGSDGSLSGIDGAIIGESLIQQAKSQFVIGQFNVAQGTSTTTWTVSDDIFILGNGTSAGARRNAYAITGDGIHKFSAGQLTSDPAGAAGYIYYNTSTNKMRHHNGTSWGSVALEVDLGSLTTENITLDLNDWNPTDIALGTIVANVTANVNLGGIVAQSDGFTLTILNVGTSNITIKTEDGGSTAANRIIGTNNRGIDSGHYMILKYSAAVARWLQPAQ